ncbi:SDR family oxidoreductase [Flavobacterium sp. CS20]|uniref:SDR family oxidoreductase n=1 Tax=Flavobacterium sp. CS20 TaxID=2775246 RepID=UPI001B3A09BC|nr:SDR family oxidoreductase [Flavobacterium sp. CS20]QTY27151.1 SDR family oxidoreductase [Flavobacterium sp. CS20]
MILITGASGHLGSATIDFLIQKGFPPNKISALVRTVEKGENLKEKGIDVKIGNYNDTDSLSKALKGVDKLLLISGLDQNRLEQHKNVINLAKENGVKHIIYTGVALTDITRSAIKSFLDDHFRTEDYIKNNGFKYTFLRNSLYSDAVPMFAGEKVVETGIFLPAGDGKVPFVYRKDLAEGTALVLAEDRHENKTYNFTGGQLYSYEDVARILTELSGKEVIYNNVNTAEFPEMLNKLGVPEEAIFIAAGFTEDVKNHLYEIKSNDLEIILGRKPTTLKSALKTIYKL